jgi:hypothetical protein
MVELVVAARSSLGNNEKGAGRRGGKKGVMRFRQQR